MMQGVIVMTPKQLEGYIFQAFEKAATRYAPPLPVPTAKSDTEELITRQDDADILKVKSQKGFRKKYRLRKNKAIQVKQEEVSVIVRSTIFIDLRVCLNNRVDSNLQRFSEEKVGYVKSIISFLTILKLLFESDILSW